MTITHEQTVHIYIRPPVYTYTRVGDGCCCNTSDFCLDDAAVIGPELGKHGVGPDIMALTSPKLVHIAARVWINMQLNG